MRHSPRPAAASLWLAVVVGGCELDTPGLTVVAPGQDQPNSYACACECGGDQRQVSAAPQHSADDAEEDVATGAVLVTGVALDLAVLNGISQAVGMRFSPLDVPPGATIVAASIQFRAAGASAGVTSLSLRGELAGDARPFSAATGDLTARRLTAAAVAWVPPPWGRGAGAGPEQRTPDLRAVVQEVVDQEGWQAGNALAVIALGTGRRAAVSFDGGAGGAPVLAVRFIEPAVTFDVMACLPAALDPNLGNSRPTEQQVAADCGERVARSVGGLARGCGYPGRCACGADEAARRFAAACSESCVEVPLAAGCGNFDPPAGVVLATNAAGDPPVCTTQGPLAAALWGQRSRCVVAGSAEVALDDLTASAAATGVVEVLGEPCPRATCPIGITYGLELAPVTFTGPWGEETFEDLAALGASRPGTPAALSSAGAGVFGPGATASTGEGRRGGERQAVVGINPQPVTVVVDWSAATCGLRSTLTSTVHPAGAGALPGADLTLSWNLQGDLYNQPPTADAGADRVVECNQPEAARFALDASASHDPDGDLVSLRWTRGGRGGPLRDPLVSQQLDSSERYVLRVLDSYGQADEDMVRVSVVDTVAPSIACNAPPTLAAASLPASFRATAQDACDPEVVPRLTEWGCLRVDAKGSIIDERRRCRVRLEGDRITVVGAEGVGYHVSWTALAVDDSGNASLRTCAVLVVRAL